MRFHCLCMQFFFSKQKTANELRISDWSSDVCSSDLIHRTRWFRQQRHKLWEKQILDFCFPHSLARVIADQGNLGPLERQPARLDPADEVRVSQPFGISPALCRLLCLSGIGNQPIERDLLLVLDDAGNGVGGAALPIAVAIRPDVGSSLTCHHDVPIASSPHLPQPENTTEERTRGKA